MKKVKLTTAIGGDRFSFRPRQVIECSDHQAGRLIDAGQAVEVSPGTEADAKWPEGPAAAEPKPAAKRQIETTAKGAGRSPESGSGAASKTCTAQTGQGNPCKRAPVAGKDRCAKHLEEV
jgi:hypothetical protein